jgi:hypothetical protein
MERSFQHAAARMSSYSRLITGISFAVSGAGNGIGFLLLYLALGPNSPDLLPYLATSAGKHLFENMVIAFSVGAVSFLVASVGLKMFLNAFNEYAARIVGALSTAVTPIFVAFLGLQFGLVFIARRGIAATDTAYNQISMLTHAAADIGGIVAIALLAGIVALVSVFTYRQKGWRLTAWLGFAIAVLSLPLFAMEASFLWLAPFALWEIVVAVSFCRRSGRASISSN